ncbi:MAG: hypothetical protein R3296_11845 [Oleiphilaceae bacterium]|nr:hypothetical protein [Oleiphilaceae bacterium]
MRSISLSLSAGLLALLGSLPVMAQSGGSGGQTMEEQLRREQRAAAEQTQNAPGRREPGSDQLKEGVPVLEAYWDGDEALHLLAGAGGRIDNGMGYIYLSHLETTGRPSSSSDRIDASLPDENDYRSHRFGFLAEGHDRDTGEGFALGLYLYRNQSDVIINRYGLGGTLDLAYVVSHRVRFYAGADLMPGFASSKAGSDSGLMEYEWHGGLRVLLGSHVDIGVVWRSGRTWDSGRRTRLYEDAMAGLRVSF